MDCSKNSSRNQNSIKPTTLTLINSAFTNRGETLAICFAISLSSPVQPWNNKKEREYFRSYKQKEMLMRFVMCTKGRIDEWISKNKQNSDLQNKHRIFQFHPSQNKQELSVADDFIKYVTFPAQTKIPVLENKTNASFEFNDSARQGTYSEMTTTQF